jgi:hypothetical protein
MLPCIVLEAHIGCSAAKNSIIFISVVDPDSLNPNPDPYPAFDVNTDPGF